MTMKSITGSFEVVTLLNRFGHGVSYIKLEEIEIAVAERQINKHENEDLIPSNCQKNIFSTFACDNNDMLGETLLGIATTHCTNGIVIQRSVDTCAEKPDDKEVNFSKKRTLEDFHIQILPYCAKKRSDPETIPPTEATVKGSSNEIEHSKKNDFLWPICILNISDPLFHIIQEAQSIPSWTGFDAILCESSIPRKSVVGYCPTIDASSTNFSTIYTLLVRSIKMADQTGQHVVHVVFD